MFLTKRVPVLLLFRGFLICFASVSSHIINTTDVIPVFYNTLLLSVLPIPLLRQVYFSSFFQAFFSCVCFVRFVQGAGRLFWRR